MKLHVTNGDAVAELLHAGGVEGAILPWRDVLHEGPVPGGLALEELSRVRARFLSGVSGEPYDTVRASFDKRDEALRGFKRHDETVLWFEHDLYDQLQLLQLLHWFSLRASRERPLSAIVIGKYPGVEPFHGLRQLTPEQVAGLFGTRSEVTAAQLELGRRGWEAFTASSPKPLQELVRDELQVLPFLRAALVRLLEEFPSTRDGLSRSERQILDVVAGGEPDLGTVFRISQIDREEAPFMGDLGFLIWVRRLASGETPLLGFEDGRGLGAEDGPPYSEELWRRRLQITESGRKVLEGRADRTRFLPNDRWLGGVQLAGDQPAWRWSHGSHEIVAQRR
jgi:hypothetical protein